MKKSPFLPINSFTHFGLLFSHLSCFLTNVFTIFLHSFAENMYIREMRMERGQLGISVIQKYEYPFFLLKGRLAVSSENGIIEMVGPEYIISPSGAKRIVYAVENCTIVTVHPNPMNTKDLNILEKYLYAFNWKDYNEFLKERKKNEKNK